MLKFVYDIGSWALLVPNTQSVIVQLYLNCKRPTKFMIKIEFLDVAIVSNHKTLSKSSQQ